MKSKDLKLLKEILSIPTYYQHENLVREFLIEYAKKHKYDYQIDSYGNLYLTKGVLDDNEYYPCVVSHIDSVFVDHIDLIENNLKKKIQNKKGILTAINPINKKQTGLAADDLCGVFICLKMLENFPKLKAAFFVEEEYGRKGSKNLDETFFKNVGYAVDFDAPSNNWFSISMLGEKIFNEKFGDIVYPILEKHNITNLSEEIYFSDILSILKKIGICCANLPTGYYNWHTNNEYIVISDVDKCILFGIEFIYSLMNKQYLYGEI